MDDPSGREFDADDALLGRCERCSWSVTAGSHSAVVEAYQDHLREHHPEAWLRG
ncbi:MAG: hypothetical protein QXG03_08145 [Halalkalicoccus sp.]